MAAQLFLCKSISGVTGTLGATGTTAPSGVRSAPSGLNAVWAVYSVTSGQTLSISDVINFCQVPENATILDGYISGVIKNGTGSIVKVGLGAAGNPSATGASTDADLISGVTLSATRVLARFGAASAGAGGMPYQVAAIAAATYPKSYPVNLTLSSGTNTSSVSIGLFMIYTTAGQ